MISSVMLTLAIVGFLAIICFGIGDKLNPPEKPEKKKTPEQEFGEAIAKYLAEVRKTGSEAKKE